MRRGRKGGSEYEGGGWWWDGYTWGWQRHSHGGTFCLDLRAVEWNTSLPV